MFSFAALRRGNALRVLVLPIASVLVIFIPIVVLRPNVFRYTGLQLLLNMTIPLSLATVGQMFAMSVGELDFSMGNLVGLVTCIVGTVLPSKPLLGLMLLVGIIGVYMLIGAFLNVRNVSSLVVTIAMSFVWIGLAVTIQPTPGGNIPLVIQNVVSVDTPLLPFPVLFMAVLALIGHFVLFRTNFGILIRGVGGNLKAVRLAGHSVTWIKAVVFGCVGFFGVLSGIALAGITTAADANLASTYTLLTIAGVMVGGGSFSGGKESVVGAVLGACVMTLVGTLLTFLQISPDWQIGAQGAVLLIVLFANGLASRTGGTKYA